MWHWPRWLPRRGGAWQRQLGSPWKTRQGRRLAGGERGQPAGATWGDLAHVQMSDRLRADYQVRARLVNFDRPHAALIAEEVAAAVTASPALRMA